LPQASRTVCAISLVASPPVAMPCPMPASELRRKSRPRSATLRRMALLLVCVASIRRFRCAAISVGLLRNLRHVLDDAFVAPPGGLPAPRLPATRLQAVGQTSLEGLFPGATLDGIIREIKRPSAVVGCGDSHLTWSIEELHQTFAAGSKDTADSKNDKGGSVSGEVSSRVDV